MYDLLAGTFVTRLDEEPLNGAVALDGGQIKLHLEVKEGLGPACGFWTIILGGARQALQCPFKGRSG